MPCPLIWRHSRSNGAPVPVLDDVSYSPLFGYAQVDVSQTGTLLFRKGAESELSEKRICLPT